MAEITIQQTSSQEEADATNEIARMFSEMDKMFAEMKQMQLNIDRMHVSTQARLADIEAALDRMATQ